MWLFQVGESGNKQAASAYKSIHWWSKWFYKISMTKTFKCICFGMIYLNMVKDTEKSNIGKETFCL